MKLTSKTLVLAVLMAGTAVGAAAPVFAQNQQPVQMQARDGSGMGNGPMMGMQGGPMADGPGSFGMMAGQNDMFAQFDTDGDGAVSAAEFAATRKAAVEGLDADGDGKLSADELLAKEVKEFEARAKTRVAARIAAQDVDGDGLLSAAELATHAAPQALFDRLDANKDGTVSADEANAMRQMMQRGGARMGQKGGRGWGDHDHGGRGGMQGKGFGGHHDGQRGGPQGRMMQGQQMNNGWMPFFQRNAPQGN